MNQKSRSHICLSAMLCRVAVICAFVLSAFAHTPSASGNGYDADFIAAYTLPDGTLPSLCLPGKGDPDTANSSACDFCRIADIFSLAEPCTNSILAHAGSIEAPQFASKEASPTHKAFRLNAPPRAPPFAA